MAKDRIESKYVTVAPGVELHILEKGEGKPLVFIPGLTFSGEIFKNQLEYFSSEYRVIAIDPRGQGYSAKTVDGNDYLTHGRDVAGLIDALGLKDIVLIGWSTGNLDTSSPSSKCISYSRCFYKFPFISYCTTSSPKQIRILFCR